MKKANTKKPTNKEIVMEINYLGQKLMTLATVVNNLSKVLDLYVSYRGQTEEFTKFLKDKADESIKKTSK